VALARSHKDVLDRVREVEEEGRLATRRDIPDLSTWPTLRGELVLA
jgi:hypothetical protein